ncbi:uncharacterized protein BO97DRAFT_442426 [Aspergillus homomorphus CBS 101889]|uniref:Amidohydrolase-related domain-containing protein n=1 Tax=Aspergillus homomorphus (strain CBS 101889) TaxID=1450537 RepID=A0A395I199_ASPHC|nr:hypothetical protein BO97DRAFT_442426 [Aspergillus homomorphus CBS 101889]RAL13393.1 hypothetical protein BO97DRAFT_442426 [Aspergillus homomorphus CBS 101889]
MGQTVEISRSRSPHTSRRWGLYLIPAILIFSWTQFSFLPRLLSSDHPATQRLSQHRLEQLEQHLQACSDLHRPPVEYDQPTAANRVNPRWKAKNGQSQAIVLRNATLFDGDRTINYPVDITFHKGVITHIKPTSQHDFAYLAIHDALVLNLDGQFVTPGLVDMHSHHIAVSSPILPATIDVDEVHPGFGPLTPFVSVLDALKAYDPVATIVASGGVTSSLILPGSENIMGGEGIPVKNLRREEGEEELVEELLLEHGVPKNERRRFMKMACGENPKDVHGHTRMGNSFLFRKHMKTARLLLRKQDDWCLAAAAARETGDEKAIADLMKDGGLPSDIDLDSSVAMLRGQVGVNIHCYESEDIEGMIRHSEEFGFRIQAFHHALEAWRVPDAIRNTGQNITVATYSHLAHYKHEAYDATLYGGKIVTEHGVPVAYISDGSTESQAAEAHSFGLPEAQALQSVTSTPARSLGLAHRIGYVQPGYDADLVIWDSHPLSNGATPFQHHLHQAGHSPKATDKASICNQATNPDAQIIITGIAKILIPDLHQPTDTTNLTLVFTSGRITCLGAANECLASTANATAIHLQNGHLLPGLTAVTAGLGLQDILAEPSTGDGHVPSDTTTQGNNLIHAKHGLHLTGSKDLQRARLGGITTAITAPLVQDTNPVFLRGVSVAFKVSNPGSGSNSHNTNNQNNENPLNTAILTPDVGLHLTIGQSGKTSLTPTISSQISLLRMRLSRNHQPAERTPDEESIYTQIANSTLPLIIHVHNHHDILHLVRIKHDFPDVYLVLLGATEAPLVASELAGAEIPVLFTGLRPNPDSWEVRDALVGKPVTEAGLKLLVEAGVRVGLVQAGPSDSGIHNLGIDAGFARKVAGLSEQRAVDLVSRDVLEILRLGRRGEVDGESDGEEGGFEGDFVVYEGNPLDWGASVVLTVDGGLHRVVECWPEAS